MNNARKITIVSALSIAFSCFIIIGNSFMQSGSFNYVEQNLFLCIALFIGAFAVFYFGLNAIFNLLDNKKALNFKFRIKGMTQACSLFNKRPFWFSLIFMIICWLPYIVSFFPAILSPDPSFQIRQYFGIPNKYSDYSVMIDPGVTITNHHPVLHTLLLGTSLKIGTLLGCANLGLFLYSLMQILVLSSTLSYTIKFLKENKLPNKYLALTLLVYSFVPSFPLYSMSAVKDVIFTSLIILYIITLYKLVKSDDVSTLNIIKTIGLTVLIFLFRNNGIHTILLSFPLLFFIKKRPKYKLKMLATFLIIIGLNISYNSFILPYFKITPSSPREMLSIPFQQTARYVKEHGEDVTEEEKRIIDKILGYDTLAERYKPEISDPVKNEFNKYANDDDLKAYFKVWLGQFKKQPKTYIEATISNTYGYYYPLKTNWYVYYNFDKRITENGFDYHYNGLENQRKALSDFAVAFPKIPLLGAFVNIGFNVWLLIFMLGYLIYRRKHKELIYLSPSFVLVLVCLASPVNCYFRYALPYVFSLMLNLGLFIKEGVLNEK